MKGHGSDVTIKVKDQTAVKALSRGRKLLLTHDKA